MAAIIRIAELSDADGILAIYRPHCESTCVSFEVAAPTVEQMRERIDRIIATYPWLVAEIDGRIAGYVYASRHHERAAYRWTVDVAVYVATTHQRRGVGRALYTTLFSILREQGLFKAMAGISLPNAASVRLHESMGFRPAAVFSGIGYKLGGWVDVGWWQLELQPARNHPPEPRPFSAALDTAAVAAALDRGKRLLMRQAGSS
jgi:phosphinothricin acetyltransferase